MTNYKVQLSRLDTTALYDVKIKHAMAWKCDCQFSMSIQLDEIK